jgi:hypothetical protein
MVSNNSASIKSKNSINVNFDNKNKDKGNNGIIENINNSRINTKT